MLSYVLVIRLSDNKHAMAIVWLFVQKTIR